MPKFLLSLISAGVAVLIVAFVIAALRPSGIRFGRLPIGPHIRTFPAAGLTGESRLDVRQSDAIRPSISGDRGPMAAVVVGAIDQDAAHARGAHLGERGDFCTTTSWKITPSQSNCIPSPNLLAAISGRR
jgi:hypothetical protein